MGKETGRYQYLDLLRGGGTLAVVLFHTSMPNEPIETITSILFSWCVPAFVMITGALYLRTEKDASLSTMISKATDLLVVLITWSLLYNLVSLSLIEKSFSKAVLLRSIIMILSADTTFCFQFWYLYLSIGLYILIPFIKPWVNKITEFDGATYERELSFFVLLLLSIGIPTFVRVINYEGHVWKDAFVPFSCYAFYLICGHFVHKFGISMRIKWTLSASVIVQLMLCIIWIVMGNSEKAIKLSGYSSVLTWSMVTLLFDIVREKSDKIINTAAGRFLLLIADNSRGIFILHVIMLTLLRKANQHFELIKNGYGFAIAQFIGAVCFSLFIAKLLKKTPIINKVL